MLLGITMRRRTMLLLAAMAAILMVVSGSAWAETSVTFAPAQKYSAGKGNDVRDVTTGDFNGDRKQDLAVLGTQGGYVHVLLGKRDGTFRPVQRFEVGGGGGYGSIIAADFNGDDKPDLAVPNQHKGVSVLLGKGDGTFTSGQRFAIGGGYGYPRSVASADFDGDDKPDLVLQSRKIGCCEVHISVLLGNGDGTFGAAQTFSLEGGSPPEESVSVGDFDGNDKADLAIGQSGVVRVLLSKGDGTFEDPQFFEVNGSLGTLAVADFNGDDKLDLAGEGDGVTVLLGNGDGTFVETSGAAVGTNPNSITSADFDGDDKPDLAVANQWSDNVSVLLGRGDGTFEAAQNFRTGGGPTAVTSADFDRDGKPDIVVGHYWAPYVRVLLNTTGA